MTPTPTPSPDFVTSVIQNFHWPDSNTAWQVLTAITIFLITAFWIDRRRAQKKAMRVDLVSVNSLVRVNEKSKSHIEVRYMGMPIGEASVIGIQFTNNGNVDILESDFTANPITFSFVPGLKILSDAVDSSPKGLGLQIKFDNALVNNILEISPFLFRRKELLTISVVVAHSGPVPIEPYEVSERLSNVSLTVGYTGKLSDSSYPLGLAITVGFLIVMAGMVLMQWGPSETKLTGYYLFLAGGFGMSIVLGMSMLLARIRKARAR